MSEEYSAHGSLGYVSGYSAKRWEFQRANWQGTLLCLEHNAACFRRPATPKVRSMRQIDRTASWIAAAFEYVRVRSSTSSFRRTRSLPLRWAASLHERVFRTFEAKNEVSTRPSRPHKAIVGTMFQCHTRMATQKKSAVVVNMVRVTAIP
jgi:hypothetical protein